MNRDFCRSALLSVALLGCVTYDYNISVYDNKGNWYYKPKGYSTWEMQRNEQEKLVDIPRGTVGPLIVKYKHPTEGNKTLRYFLIRGFDYGLVRWTDGTVDLVKTPTAPNDE